MNNINDSEILDQSLNNSATDSVDVPVVSNEKNVADRDLPAENEGMDENGSHSVSPRSNHRLAYLIFALCFLLGLLLIPSLAERIAFSLSRGTESARRLEAMKLLEKAPDTATLIPWVVKAVSASVVGIKSNMHNRMGQGTGIILDEQGHILTNLHVILNNGQLAEGAEICLSDGRVQRNGIELIGYDEQHDLALLKIDFAGVLHPLSWGNSDVLEVGEPVLAIGYPYGLAHTVTQGIVSAKNRYNMTPDGLVVQEYLQTDAAVNPGNSGGPLVNMKGELVGINTAIVGESYQGISFAIPSRIAKEFSEKLLKKAK